MSEKFLLRLGIAPLFVALLARSGGGDRMDFERQNLATIEANSVAENSVASLTFGGACCQETLAPGCGISVIER